jgi:hypothetical protein
MSSTYSPNLRIELIGSGDQAGAWGATTNSNLAFVLDTAIAGYQAVTVSSTAQALTYVNGPSSTANLNQSVYAILKFNSAAAASAIYAPPVSKQYIIWNNSSFTITIYNSTVIGNTTAAGAGIAIAAGDKIMVWSDGTDFYDVQAQNLTGTLAIANGGTGQTTQQAAINALTGSQTNNRVLRSDGTNATLSQVNVSTDVTGTLAVANGGTGVTTAAAITALVGNLLFPLGSIYLNAGSSVNPATLLGFGTWTAYGGGRVMIGHGGSFVGGATGGSADAVLVSHTHTATTTSTDAGHVHFMGRVAGGNGGLNFTPAAGMADISPNTGTGFANITSTTTVASAGSSGTNANLQPYIVAYMWQRTG